MSGVCQHSPPALNLRAMIKRSRAASFGKQADLPCKRLRPTGSLDLEHHKMQSGRRPKTLFFTVAAERSVAAARRAYCFKTLKLLRPSLLRNFKSSPTYNHFGMYKNYLSVAWRNLIKKKGYSVINIFGLALGITCCMLIFMYVSYERSFDDYHAKGDRIYRVIHGNRNNANATESYWVWHNAPIGPALKSNFPEIDKVVQFSGRADILLSEGETSFQEERVFFMDSTAFDVFSWKLLKGNPKTALAAPFSIVLTESTARKFFGDEDPVGKTLTGSESAGRSDAGGYLVTGVMEDVPANSHFRFNALVSMSTFRKSRPQIFKEWGYVDFYTYFLVNEQFDRATFESKIPAFLKRQTDDPKSEYHI